jgi:hypothetical protein
MGGVGADAGEVALAHHNVLLLAELPEFRCHTLELLPRALRMVAQPFSLPYSLPRITGLLALVVLGGQVQNVHRCAESRSLDHVSCTESRAG